MGGATLADILRTTNNRMGGAALADILRTTNCKTGGADLAAILRTTNCKTGGTTLADVTQLQALTQNKLCQYCFNHPLVSLSVNPGIIARTAHRWLWEQESIIRAFSVDIIIHGQSFLVEGAHSAGDQDSSHQDITTGQNIVILLSLICRGRSFLHFDVKAWI